MPCKLFLSLEEMQFRFQEKSLTFTNIEPFGCMSKIFLIENPVTP